MRDWKAIAKAQGGKIAAADVDTIVAPLEEAEEILHSLIPDLTPEIEPAFEVRQEDGE